MENVKSAVQEEEKGLRKELSILKDKLEILSNQTQGLFIKLAPVLNNVPDEAEQEAGIKSGGSSFTEELRERIVDLCNISSRIDELLEKIDF